MLAEYALDPELLGTWGEFRYYVSQFGVPKGRLISEFPDKWKRMVREVAKGKARDREYLDIIEALDRLDRELMPREDTFDTTKSWLKNAIEENKRDPFHAIITTTKSGRTKNLIDGAALDPTKPHKLWAIPTSVHIERASTQLAACVALLLSLCDEVLFIDPYFGPGARKYFEPLQLFLSALANRGTRRMPTRIEYHGGNQDADTNTYNQNLERNVKPHLPPNITMSVVRWSKTEMHNRYILTDRGGVMFGHGLNKDDSDPVGHDTVSLLDDKTCAELMDDYSAQSTKLTWLSEIFSVTGS